jgi:hypothetical protein
MGASPCAVLGTIVYLRPYEYKRATDQAFRTTYGSAYGACVNFTLLELDRILLNPLARPETVSIFLEDGHANALDGIKQIRELKELTDPVPDELEGHEITILGAGPVAYFPSPHRNLRAGVER